jgi:TRAP-type C4-dicarboxylate transport system permease small subunit
MRPRLFSSRLTPTRRRLYRGVVVFFLVVLLAMIWPVATLFSHARPLVLGLPFYLFYLAVLLVGSFLVLLALYVWENRTGSSSDPGEDSL